MEKIVIGLLAFLALLVAILLFLSKLAAREEPKADRKWTDPNSRRR